MTDPYVSRYADPQIVEVGTRNGTAVDDMPVFDLNRAIAESRPVAPFRFRFGADVYELPGRPDTRAVAALTSGRLDDALRMLLGAHQWERLQQVDLVFDSEALRMLLDAYAKHADIDLGEQQGSSR